MADLSTIRAIHAKLLARYGSAWRAKYAGIESDMVEADWAQELGHVSGRSLDYAFQHLPLDFPPTAGQFRQLCWNAPATKVDDAKLLAPPKPDPERLKAVFEKLARITAGRSPTQWIDDLEEQERNGRKLSIFQRQCIANAKANLSQRMSDVTITSEDSRRTDELKRQSAARVAKYLEEHPELRP